MEITVMRGGDLFSFDEVILGLVKKDLFIYRGYLKTKQNKTSE